MRNKDKNRKIVSWDVATRAGVSQSTVSRALSGSTCVSPATRDRVQRIAKELAYCIDPTASRFRSGRSDIIAVVVIQPSEIDNFSLNPFHYNLVSAICAAATSRGLQTLVSFQSDARSLKGDYEPTRKALGLIVLGTSKNPHAWEFFRRAAQSGQTVVAWEAPCDDIVSVGVNNRLGAMKATQHLIEAGCNRVTFLGVHNGPPQFVERCDGYERVTSARKLPSAVCLARSACDRFDQGRQAAEQLIASGMIPDGIVAACDDLALGALNYMREYGICVPTQLKIVGFDGSRAAEWSFPPLSSVEPNFIDAGVLLVKKLLEFKGGQPTRIGRVGMRLIVRDSSL